MSNLIEQTTATLNRLGCSQYVFAQMMGVDNARMSRLLNPRIPLSPKLQQRFTAGLTFLTSLQDSSRLPVCFHDFQRLEKLWNEFMDQVENSNGDDRVSTGAVASAVAR